MSLPRLVTLAVLAASGAHAQTAPPPAIDVSTFVPIKDPAQRFSLRLPPGWTIEEPEDDVCFLARYDRTKEGGLPDVGLMSITCDASPMSHPMSSGSIVATLDTQAGLVAFLDQFETTTGGEYVSHGPSSLGGLPATRIGYRVPFRYTDGFHPLLHSVMYWATETGRPTRFYMHCGTTSPDLDLCDALAGTVTFGVSGAIAPGPSRPSSEPQVDEEFRDEPLVTWNGWTAVRAVNPFTDEEDLSVRTGSNHLGLMFVCHGGGPIPLLLHETLRGDGERAVEFSYRFDRGPEEGPFRARLLRGRRGAFPFEPSMSGEYEGGTFLGRIGGSRTLSLTVTDPGTSWQKTETLNVRNLSRALGRMPCQ